ncbi:MAG: sigma-E processing peptidase SpoIIGA [Alicyclobacillus shizuokensis]|nr:sigma-E processing peptidase SpoIIGA [Alicyclobacillus shizuokensis]
MPVVYLDVVWLINFVMDGLLLATSAWICRRPLRPKRILAAALLGAMYAVLLFFPSLAWLTSWPGKVVVSLAMVAVAIPCRRWLEWLRVSVMFYFVSFVFAGAAMALHYAVPGTSLATAQVQGSRIAFATSLESLGLLVAIVLAGFLLRYAAYRWRVQTQHAGAVLPVRVVFNGESVTLMGLVDTGNRLRDPVSRKPVCLADASACAGLLPQPLWTALVQRGDLLSALEQVEDGQGRHRFTLVPLQGAGGAQLALAFRPDAVELRHGQTWRAGGACLIALHAGELSSDRDFQMILHAAVITEADGFDEFPVASTDSTAMAHADASVVDSHPGSIGRRL